MTQSDSAEPNSSPTPVVVDASTFTEGHLIRVKRLERELASARKWALKSTRQLHACMAKTLKSATSEAARSSTRGGGWAPRGWASHREC